MKVKKKMKEEMKRWDEDEDEGEDDDDGDEDDGGGDGEGGDEMDVEAEQEVDGAARTLAGGPVAVRGSRRGGRSATCQNKKNTTMRTDLIILTLKTAPHKITPSQPKITIIILQSGSKIK